MPAQSVAFYKRKQSQQTATENYFEIAINMNSIGNAIMAMKATNP